MKKYACYEDGIQYDTIEAASIEEAVEEAKDRFDMSAYGEATSTTWVRVLVENVDDEEERRYLRFDIHPAEPECTTDDGRHQWESPIEVVGGISDNPGVFAHGGGVVITEVCRHCAAYRVTDTWAQDPSTGEQGLRAIEYRDADDDSREWAERLFDEAS